MGQVVGEGDVSLAHERAAVSMPTVRRYTTSEAPAEVLAQVRRLLLAAFAGDFSVEDWAHTLGGTHVVVTDDGVVVAHAAVVPRVLEVGGRPWRTGYVEGVGTFPARQHEGLATLAMREVADLLGRQYSLGALSTGRPDWYARLGWERWRGPTFVRRGERLARTEDEDAGIMVLRLGPSAHLDLTATLSCEQRSGDDW